MKNRWWDGWGVVGWKDGEMSGGMVEWMNGGMVEWMNGGMVEEIKRGMKCGRYGGE